MQRFVMTLSIYALLVLCGCRGPGRPPNGHPEPVDAEAEKNVQTPAIVLCPQCGTADSLTPISYGLPGLRLGERAERGEVVLGGCMGGEFSPDRHCRSCGLSFYSDPNHALRVALTTDRGARASISHLLDSGADPNPKPGDGPPPLLLAIRRGRFLGSFVAVEALLEKGADPNVTDKDGKTALQIALRDYRGVMPALLHRVWSHDRR